MRRPTRTSSVLTSEMSRSGGFVEENLVGGALGLRRVTGEGQRRGSCGTGLRDGVRGQASTSSPRLRRIKSAQRRFPLGGRPAAPGS